MKLWIIAGIIAVVALLALGGVFMAKNLVKAETKTTGASVSTSTGCGCGIDCACGCKGQCTEGSDCGCLEKGCSAAKGTGACGCSK